MSNEILIGAKIAEGRRRKGLSQSQLADIMMVSAPAVSKWERGESMPDILTLNRLAAAFGTDLNYFMIMGEGVSENAGVSENTKELEGKTANGEAFKQEGELQEERSKITSEPVIITNLLASDYAFAANARVDKPQEEGSAKKMDMTCWNWKNADFSGMNNTNGKFGLSNIESCNFANSVLDGSVFTANKIERCDFSLSNIKKAKFSMASVEGNIFCDSFLNNSVFSLCHIKNNDFSGTDFSDTVFKGCNFSGNDLETAILKGTEFKNCSIKDIDFSGEISDCAFIGCNYKGVVFKNVKFTRTFFKSQGLKNVKFIDCTADHTTYSFLQNTKAELLGISRA